MISTFSTLGMNISVRVPTLLNQNDCAQHRLLYERCNNNKSERTYHGHSQLNTDSTISGSG